MNLEGWEYVLTFGFSLDIYAKGNDRIMVNRNSGRVVLRFTVDEQGGEDPPPLPPCLKRAILVQYP